MLLLDLTFFLAWGFCGRKDQDGAPDNSSAIIAGVEAAHSISFVKWETFV